MNVVITGVNPDKKIQAIKVVRGVSGLGLKEAKYLVDDVVSGNERELSLQDPKFIAELDEGYVTWHEKPATVALADFVTVLGRYPRHLTVDDLYATLLAAVRASDEERSS